MYDGPIVAPTSLSSQWTAPPESVASSFRDLYGEDEGEGSKSLLFRIVR